MIRHKALKFKAKKVTFLHKYWSKRSTWSTHIFSALRPTCVFGSVLRTGSLKSGLDHNMALLACSLRSYVSPSLCCPVDVAPFLCCPVHFCPISMLPSRCCPISHAAPSMLPRLYAAPAKCCPISMLPSRCCPEGEKKKRESCSLHKERVGCISSSAKQRAADGSSKTWSCWGPLLCSSATSRTSSAIIQRRQSIGIHTQSEKLVSQSVLQVPNHYLNWKVVFGTRLKWKTRPPHSLAHSHREDGGQTEIQKGI